MWKEYKIGEIFTITRGQVLATSKTSTTQSLENPYPVYSSQTKKNGLMGFYKSYLFDTAITWTTDGANAGTVKFREGKFFSTNVNGVLLSNNGYANIAVAEALNKVAWKYVSKVGNPKLMNNVMSEIKIRLPETIEEQNKISSFFKDLDETISLHQQELDALKQTKQGFLQKMFPKEGQSLPEIRFKEFLSPWKEYRLSELSKVTTGKAFKSTDFKINGDYLVITNKNIQDEENEIISKGDRINISDEVILNKYLLSGKNILVTMDGVNIGKTGRYSNNMAVLAQRVGRINSEQFEFIYQITKSPKFISTMNQISVGNAIKHISLQQIADYTFMAPTEVAERLKIGEFFKDIDELILLTDKKIKGLQSTKKGFLQKMFV